MTCRLRALTLGLSVALLVPGCGGTPERAPAAPLSDQDSIAIRGLFERSEESLRTGTLGPWLDVYADDAVFQAPFRPTLRGKDALRAFAEGLPAREQFEFTNVEVHGSGDLAYATSDYTLKLEGMPPETGKQLVVLRRNADGAWKAVAVSYSADQPPPATTPVP